MGKMKELFIQQMNERIADMSDAEYQDHLHSAARDTYSDTDEKGEPATQEQVESEHDAWWNSLTDEQKQQLFKEQEAVEKERIELSIEEMNHDLGFGK